MKFLGFLILIFPLFVQGADIYGKHRLCLKNPQDSYMTGDANSAYPSCGKEYAVIHVPTELSEKQEAQQKIKSLEAQITAMPSTNFFSGQIAFQELKYFYSELLGLVMAVFLGLVIRAVLIVF